MEDKKTHSEFIRRLVYSLSKPAMRVADRFELGLKEMSTDNVYVVTSAGEERHCVTGKIGFPYFPNLILDCLNRTEAAMTQAHCFKAAELCLNAQMLAERSNS